MGERERQLREDLERAHRAEVDALLKRIDALEEPDFAPGAVRRIYAALSAQDYERAQSLLAAMEETEIQAKVHLALGAQVRIRTLRAETSLLSGDTGAAVEHFETAASLVESFEPGQGAHHRNAAALRLSSYADRFGGDGVARAIELYRTNLKHWPREDHPEEWAGTQRNLANSYIRLSQRTDEKAFDYLAKAEGAFGAALEVHTRESHPAEWAADQFNLGAAHLSYARRLGGQRSTRLLEAGIRAIRAALEELSREDGPGPWATAQHNLGAGLTIQGQRQGGGSAALESFGEAVQAFRAAISVRTPDADPIGWYSSQSNFGAVLVCQAQLLGPEEGTSHVLEAIAIFREILDVRTRESDPVGWAGTQGNLGGALSRLAECRGGHDGAEHAKEAIQALQSALEVFTREFHPTDWFTTQMQLASALQRCAGLPGEHNPIELLSQAVGILRAALHAVRKEDNPALWADSKYRLGIALVQWSNLTSGPEKIRQLADASSAFREALRIITRDDQPSAWASLHNNLGYVHESLGDLDPRRREKNYRESVFAFERALTFLETQTSDEMTRDTETARRRVSGKLTAIAS